MNKDFHRWLHILPTNTVATTRNQVETVFVRILAMLSFVQNDCVNFKRMVLSEGLTKMTTESVYFVDVYKKITSGNN